MTARTIHLVELSLDKTGTTAQAVFGFQEGGKTFAAYIAAMPEAEATQDKLTAILADLQAKHDRIAALEEALTPRVTTAPSNLRIVH